MQENLSQKLPSGIADLEINKSEINPTVAISETLGDDENKRVVFSFETYNSGQCEISNLDKMEAKKLTKELKKISTVLCKYFRHQNISGIECSPVLNCNNYESLFNGMPEDVEMLEVYYSGAGRIFGFIVSNVFNIVAIGKKHR